MELTTESQFYFCKKIKFKIIRRCFICLLTFTLKQMPEDWSLAEAASHLFSAFASLIEVSAAVQRPLNQLVPASLDAEQQVLDKNHILL